MVCVKKETGPTLRYQARLVSLRFLQHHGVDFFETYAAVASVNSIRILISACCAIGYISEQIDVDTAYLNEQIQEVYVEVPNFDRE